MKECVNGCGREREKNSMFCKTCNEHWTKVSQIKIPKPKPKANKKK